MDLHWLTDPQIWIALATLTLLEIVLGIDNIIFIAILAGKLPADQQGKARQAGLAVALVTRLLLLFAINLVLRLKYPVFSLPVWPLRTAEAQQVSWRDIILIVGGLFLIGKSTYEIHANLEGEEPHAGAAAGGSRAGFAAVLVQIALLD